MVQKCKNCGHELTRYNPARERSYIGHYGHWGGDTKENGKFCQAPKCGCRKPKDSGNKE